jgi:ubiquinone/menaquinone biosynthesis C-methylase UbiE
MTHAAGLPIGEASAVFDNLAESYDELFTRSSIGRAQRGIVWRALESAFHNGNCILELNCGTGEDALFLSRRGVSVVACDASARMIDVAQRRKSSQAPQSAIQFRILRTEDLSQLQSTPPFDGVLSNFSGLNCVADLRPVASDLATLTKPGAPVLICLSSRFCLWEIVWFAFHANPRKALRRLRGGSIARVAEQSVQVWYPTIRSVRRSFAPWFRLRSHRAVGLAVPPSYVRSRTITHPKVISQLEKIDRALGRLPLLRAAGDHVFLHFERIQP